jgi:hypothetical protein
MVEDMASQWARILRHLRALQKEKPAPAYRDKRSHKQHGASRIVNEYARAEMKRRQCHKG